MFNKNNRVPLWMFLFANNAYDSDKMDKIIKEKRKKGSSSFKVNGKDVRVLENGDIEVTNSTK